MSKKNSLFLLLGIVLVGFFLRFYKFGLIPPGLINDEADYLYDAYSFLHTGFDQWGHAPGLFLQGFGDYRPALSTSYILIPFVYFWGLTQIAARLPSLIAGVLAIPLIYTVGKNLYNRTVGFCSALLLATLPWAVGLSRINNESTIGLLVLILSFNFVLKWRDKAIYLPLAAISLAGCFYIYSPYSLFIPLFIIAFIFLHAKKLWQKKKIAIVSILFFLIISSPILLFGNKTATTRFNQVGLLQNINSIGVINKINAEQGSCFKVYPVGLCKIVINKPIAFIDQFATNYIHHFSFEFLYEQGSATQYSILPQIGLAYFFELPLLFLGILFIFVSKKERQSGVFLLFLFFLSPIPDSLTGDGHFARASLMIPFVVLIESLGIYFLFNNIIEHVKSPYKAITFMCLIGVYAFSVVLFFISYTSYFPDAYGFFSQYGYKQVMTDISKQKSSYDQIYISDFLNNTKQYIYYLVYTAYDPKKYQSGKYTSFHTEAGGWISIDRIDNIYFVHNLSYSQSFARKKVLLIGNPHEFSPSVVPVGIVKDHMGNPIFYEVIATDPSVLQKTSTE